MRNIYLKWFITPAITAIIICIANSIFANITKEQAIIKILTITHANSAIVDIYVANEEYKKNSYVKLIDRKRIKCPYSGNWVFFIDENPFSGWYHDCRIIFVSSENGELTTYSEKVFPSGLKTDFKLISAAPRPTPPDLPGNVSNTPSTGIMSNYNYAMIVCALDEQTYWNDVSLIYNTLISEYNYDKQNIFVHYNWNGSSSLPNGNDLDGNDVPSNDIKYDATWNRVIKTLKNLSGQLSNDPEVPQLEPGDQLAIFFTGTPVSKALSKTMVGLWSVRRDAAYIQTQEIDATAQIVDDIECSQMAIMFAVNYASQMADKFQGSNAKCKNRYVFHNTGSSDLSHKELWITGGNYTEFVFYWASAARGSYPNPKLNEPWKEWIVTGTFPFRTITGFNTHPEDYVPDINKDGFLQMTETLSYASNLDTWCNNGFYFNQYHSNQGSESPGVMNLFPFAEDIVTLAGLSGQIDQTQIIPARSYIIADKLIIAKNVTLALNENSQIFLHRNLNRNSNGYAYIYCEEKSNLQLGNKTVIINNNEAFNSAYVEFQGDEIIIGDQVEFVKVDLYAAPALGNLELNLCRFNSCLLNSYKCNVEIINCGFDKVFQYHSSKNLKIEGSNFYKSSAWLLGSEQDSYFVKVNNCTFDGICPFLNWNIPLNIHYFGSFDISDNILQSNDYGISMNYTGWGDSIHQITDNEIFNQNKRGLVFYLSRANISGNNIHNNGWSGLAFNNNCNLILEGNRNALSVNQTQRIMDNDRYELYTDESSFPVIMSWNAIIDSDNSIYELIYCVNSTGATKDVRYNYWNGNFDPHVDFYPPNEYIYQPVFNLGDKEEELDEATSMYLNGRELITQKKYILAKAEFRNLIRLYPDSKFASAALKELFVVEKSSTNNYIFLKHYYTTDDIVQGNTELKKIGEFFANRCDVKMGNWVNAINWYENIIQNPTSESDSIYAIIDLGFVYLLKEKYDDPTVISLGLPQYKPRSFIDHVDHSLYLQSILQENKINEP